MAEFGAEPVIVAEVVDQRAPPSRIDVLGSRHDYARIRVDLENLGLDDDELPGDAGPHVGGAGLHLKGTFGDAGRPDHVSGFRPQIRGGELARLETEGAALVRGYRAAPGQRCEPFDCPPLRRSGDVDHQVVAAEQILGGLTFGTEAQDDDLAQRPRR